MKNHMKRRQLVLGFIIVLNNFTFLEAQDPSNIYSFSFEKVDGEYQFSQAKFLNSYNEDAYNNQPSFTDTERILVTSKLRDSTQTDIQSLNLYTKEKYQVTDTPESEYSPQLHSDGEHFTCVRVEMDGKTQHLYQVPIDHSTQGKLLFPDVDNVGYYHWLDQYHVAMFLVDEPHSLAIGDIRDDNLEPITSNIGRGMGKAANGDLLYIQKLSERTWYIKRLNIDTKKSTIVTETLDGAEDFVVMADGSILMAQGSVLFLYDPSTSNNEWIPIGDLKRFGLNNIHRLAYNGNQLLVLVDSLMED